MLDTRGRRPTRDQVRIDDTFPDDFLRDLCGIETTTTITGHFGDVFGHEIIVRVRGPHRVGSDVIQYVSSQAPHPSASAASTGMARGP